MLTAPDTPTTPSPFLPKLPTVRPHEWPMSSRSTGEGRETVDEAWVQLILESVHPVKVAVLEALHWIDEPLSATELEKIIGPGEYKLGVISYHVSELAKRGVIQQVAERQARGARESYYFFPAA